MCQYHIESNNGMEWEMGFCDQLIAIKRNKVSSKASQWTVISYYTV